MCVGSPKSFETYVSTLAHKHYATIVWRFQCVTESRENPFSRRIHVPLMVLCAVASYFSIYNQPQAAIVTMTGLWWEFSEVENS